MPVMTRDQLCASAQCLLRDTPGVADDYAGGREALVVAVDRMLLRRPDLDDLIGPGNRALMQDNHRHHAAFIEALLRHYDAAVLTDSVLWVFRSYRARGFQPAYWTAEIAAWVAALGDCLAPPTRDALAPLYRWLGDHCETFAALTDPPAAGSRADG